MKEQMKRILQQQQEYEFIKQSPSIQQLPDAFFRNTATSKVVLPYMKEASRKKKRKMRFKKIAQIVFGLFVGYFIYAFIVLLGIILFFPDFLS